MRLFLTSVLILCYLISSSEALKDAVCGLRHSKAGHSLPGVVSLEYGPKYSYDSENKKCVPFIYAGFHGNANRFGSEAECKERCVE